MILRKLDANERHRDSPIQQLFVLQRVNKLFMSTISRSVHLRRRMLLEYNDPTAKDLGCGLRYAALAGFAPDGLSLKGSLGIHNVCDFSGQSMTGRKLEFNALTLALPDTWLRPRWEAINPRKDCSTTPSWRSMKLMPWPRKFDLYLCFGPRTQHIHHAHFAFEDGNATLGDLYDRLKLFRSDNRYKHTPKICDFHTVRKTIISAHDLHWVSGTSIHDPVYDAARKIKESHAILEDCGRRHSLCAVCALDRYSEMAGMWAAL